MSESKYFKGKKAADVIDQYVEMVGLVSSTLSRIQGCPDFDEPRQLPDQRGIVTAVGLKRHVRDTAALRLNKSIFIGQGDVLRTNMMRAVQDATASGEFNPDLWKWDEKGVKAKKPKNGKGKESEATEQVAAEGGDDEDGGEESKEKKIDVKAYETERAQLEVYAKYHRLRYWDHMFGAVITKPLNTKIRGAVQFSFAVSIDPVTVERVRTTRCAIATDEGKKSSGAAGTFAQFPVVVFGLYRFSVVVNRIQAQQSQLTWGTLDELIECIVHMWGDTVAAPRVGTTFERLDVFTYDSLPLGVDRKLLKVKRTTQEPRSADDYEVMIAELPGVAHFTVRLDDFFEKASYRTESLRSAPRASI